MKYRRLGRTNLMVSEIGLGAEWLERHNAEECKAVISACEEAGVNLLDCWMSEPNVRTNIGAAIRGRREKWIIEGHFRSRWHNGQHSCTLDAAEMREAFDDLLTRLGTDYIDIGMVHYVDNDQVFEAVTTGPVRDYLLEMKSRGIVRFLGASSHHTATAQKIVECGLFDVLLFSLNPAYDMLPAESSQSDYFAETYREDLAGIDPGRVELYQLCEQYDVGMNVMKSYAGGRLFDAKRSAFGVPLTPVQCIHYALTRPGVASVLPGMETLDQVRAALAYETATPEEKDYATVLAHAPRHAFTGQCTYCGHCRPCPVDIDVAMVGKLYDLALVQPSLPSSLRQHYLDLTAHASDCIGCGGCEARCPFQVPVRERLRAASALFGK